MKKLCILAFCLLFAFSSADAAKGIKRAKGGKKGGRKVEKVEKAQREQERIERQTPRGKTEREGMRDELRYGGKPKTPGITDNKIFEGGEKSLSGQKILSEGKGRAEAKGEKKQPGTTSLNRTGRARITMKDTGNEIGMQGAKDLKGDLGKDTKVSQTNPTVERAIAAAERKTVEAEQAPQAKLPKEVYSDINELVHDVYDLAEGKGELYLSSSGEEMLVFQLPGKVRHHILGEFNPTDDIVVYFPEIDRGSVVGPAYLDHLTKAERVVRKEEIGSKVYPSLNDLGRDLYDLVKGNKQVYTDFRGEEVVALELPSKVRYTASKSGLVSEMTNHPQVRALYDPKTGQTSWVGTHYVDNFLLKKSEEGMAKPADPITVNRLTLDHKFASFWEVYSARDLSMKVHYDRIRENERIFAVGFMDAEGKILYAERTTLDVLSSPSAWEKFQQRLPFLILTVRRSMPRASMLVIDRMEMLPEGKTPAEKFPAFLNEGYRRNISEYIYNVKEGELIGKIDPIPSGLETPRFLVDSQSKISVVDMNVLKEAEGKLEKF